MDRLEEVEEEEDDRIDRGMMNGKARRGAPGGESCCEIIYSGVCDVTIALLPRRGGHDT